MRTADPHLIYRCSDGARINPSRRIVLGDHVWVGQGAMILKGSSIGSGAILGGGAVCAGKTIPSNTSWAGNPAKQLAKGVFFTKDSVHNYSAEQTEQSQHSKLKKFTYKPSADTIESPMKATAVQLSEVASADEKLELVQALFGNTAKSRFAIHEKPAPKPEPKPEPKKKSFARRAVGKAKRMLKG
jgi:hypothetical protein